jgi:hypothetical protein
VIVIVIVLSHPGGGEGLFGSPKPLLIKVQFASSADVPLEVSVVSVHLVDLERVLHLLLAKDAANDVELVLVIDGLKL